MTDKYKKRNRSNQLVLFVIILLIVSSSVMPVSTSYAKTSYKKTNNNNVNDSSWRPNSGLDSKVYGNEKGIEIKNDTEESKPGIAEGLLIGILVSVGDWLGWLFNLLGISLKNVIYGRVNGGGVSFDGTRISLFTFELTNGNPYGIVAASIYSSIRSIIYVILACVVFTRFVVVVYFGNTAKAWNTVKENFGNMLLGFALLTLIPYILDLFLYLRDVMLYTIGVKGMTFLGISTPDITSFFKETAENSIMSSFMYFGSYILCLYFAFQYVGLAMSLVVDLITFPFICLSMQFNRRAFGTWCGHIFSNTMVPIIDCCLLMIPAVFSLLGDSIQIKIIQLLVCTMLIPARMEFRNVLGVATNKNMELSGVMAMRGAATLAGSAISGTVGAISGKMDANKEAMADEKMANYYDSLDKTGVASGNSSFSNRAAMAGGVNSGFRYDASVGSNIGGGFTGYGTANPEGEDIRDGSVGSAMKTANMEEPIANQNQADSYADINNFENRDFRDISNQRRAELYRQRAADTRRRSTGAMVGKMAGTAAGMAAGLGAGTFLSAGTKGMMMGAMGMAAGNALGSVGGRVGGLRAAKPLENSMAHQADIGVGTDSKGNFRKENFDVENFERSGTLMSAGTYSQMQYESSGLYASGIDTAMDMPDYRFVGAVFAKQNGAEIESCASKSLNFDKNTAVRSQLQSVYTSIQKNNELSGNTLDSQAQYESFRGQAEQIILNDFSQRFLSNSNIKNSGNDQIDHALKRNTIETFKNHLGNADNFSLSRTNLELNGWNFNN